MKINPQFRTCQLYTDELYSKCGFKNLYTNKNLTKKYCCAIKLKKQSKTCFFLVNFNLALVKSFESKDKRASHVNLGLVFPLTGIRGELFYSGYR